MEPTKMKTLISVLIAGLSGAALTQDGFPITTDRPSFSDGTLIVPKGRWQIEAGYTINDLDGARFETIGELLFRYPLSNVAEFRLSNVSLGWTSGSVPRNDGLLDPVLGVKLKLQNGVTGKSPDLAVVLQSTIPAGDRIFRVDRAQPTAKLAFYQQTDATTGVGGNVIVADLGIDSGRFTQYAASLYVSKTLNAQASAFLEVYRLMPISDDGPDANFADAGMAYLLNPRTQVDFRVGTGFDQKRDGWFLGFGVAYRF